MAIQWPGLSSKGQRFGCSMGQPVARVFRAAGLPIRPRGFVACVRSAEQRRVRAVHANCRRLCAACAAGICGAGLPGLHRWDPQSAGCVGRLGSAGSLKMSPAWSPCKAMVAAGGTFGTSGPQRFRRALRFRIVRVWSTWSREQYGLTRRAVGGSPRVLRLIAFGCVFAAWRHPCRGTRALPYPARQWWPVVA